MRIHRYFDEVRGARCFCSWRARNGGLRCGVFEAFPYVEADSRERARSWRRRFLTLCASTGRGTSVARLTKQQPALQASSAAFHPQSGAHVNHTKNLCASLATALVLTALPVQAWAATTSASPTSRAATSQVAPRTQPNAKARPLQARSTLAAPSKPRAAQPFSEERRRRYAEQDRQDQKSDDYKGGVTLVIGGGVLIVALIVVLVIVLVD